MAGKRATPGIVAAEATVYPGVPYSSILQLLEDRHPLLLQITRTLCRLAPSPIVRGELESTLPRPGRPPDFVERVAFARNAPPFGDLDLTRLL